MSKYIKKYYSVLIIIFILIFQNIYASVESKYQKLELASPITFESQNKTYINYKLLLKNMQTITFTLLNKDNTPFTDEIKVSLHYSMDYNPVKDVKIYEHVYIDRGKTKKFEIKISPNDIKDFEYELRIYYKKSEQWVEIGSDYPYPLYIFKSEKMLKGEVRTNKNSVIKYNNFIHYYQTDEKWKADLMQDCGFVTWGGVTHPDIATIGLGFGQDYQHETSGVGCKMSCYAMVIQALGKGANPRLFNNYVRNKNLYSNAAFINEDSLGYFNDNNGQILLFSRDQTKTHRLPDLKTKIDEGKVALVQNNGHWVLVYRYDNEGTMASDFKIVDPWEGRCYANLKNRVTLQDHGITSTLPTVCYVWPANGHTFKTSFSEIYEYKHLNTEGDTNILVDTNINNIRNFDYFGAAEFFDFKDAYITSNTIVSKINDSNTYNNNGTTVTVNDINQKYIYTKYWFTPDATSNYKINLSLYGLTNGTKNATYTVREVQGFDDDGTIIATSQAIDHTLTGGVTLLFAEKQDYVKLEKGKKYALYCDNVTGEDDKEVAFGTITIEKSDYVGQFTHSSALDLTFYQSSSDLGDIDNDGNLDLLICGLTSNGAKSKIYTNIFNNKDSINTLNPSNDSYSKLLSGVSNGSAKFGDFNNDGLVDVIIAGGGGVNIYLNNGSGLMTGMSYGISVKADYSSLALGDVDNDGDLDVVISCSNNTLPELLLYTNTISNGKPSFQKNNIASYTDGNGVMGKVMLRDDNGDGILDLLVAGKTSGHIATGADGFSPPNVELKVFKGTITDGKITYSLKWDMNSFLVTLDKYFMLTHDRAVDWADADGDGDLDIVVSGMMFTRYLDPLYPLKYSFMPNQVIEVFYQTSLLGYQPLNKTIFKIQSESDASLAWEIGSGSMVKWYDYNGDGYMDIVAACEEGYQIRSKPAHTMLFTNTGASNSSLSFTRSLVEFAFEKEDVVDGKPTGLIDVHSGSISIANIDGKTDSDASMDLVISGLRSNGTRSSIIYNNEVTQIGAPISVDLKPSVKVNKKDDNNYTLQIDWGKIDGATYDLQLFRIVSGKPSEVFSIGTGFTANLLYNKNYLFPNGNLGSTNKWQINGLKRGEYRYILTAVFPHGVSKYIENTVLIVEEGITVVSPKQNDILNMSAEELKAGVQMKWEKTEAPYRIHVSDNLNMQDYSEYSSNMEEFSFKKATFHQNYFWFVIDKNLMKSKTHVFRVNKSWLDTFARGLFIPDNSYAQLQIKKICDIVNKQQYVMYGKSKKRNRSDEYEPKIEIYTANTSNDTFSLDEQLSLPLTALDAMAVEVADLNADTYNDFVITGIDPQSGVCTTDVYLYSTSTERYVKSFSLPGVKNGTITVRDYDGDGDLDILIAGEDAQGLNYSAMVLEQKEQNGSIAFAVIRTIPIIGTKPIAAWDDTDADGILDVLVMTDTNSTVYINADPAQPQPFTIPGYHDGSATFADLQPDPGKELVVSGKTNGNYETILYTKSDTSYIPNPISIQGAIFAMQAMDFNRDGSLDLIMSSRLTSDDALYKKYIPNPVYRRGREQIADGPIVTKILLNRNGYFEDSGIELPIMKDGGFTLCDYDNDGKTDIILTGTDYNDTQVAAVYINNEFAFLEPPVTITPEEGATVGTTQVALTWDAVETAQSYNVQVSDKADFTVITDVQYGDFTA